MEQNELTDGLKKIQLSVRQLAVLHNIPIKKEKVYTKIN